MPREISRDGENTSERLHHVRFRPTRLQVRVECVYHPTFCIFRYVLPFCVCVSLRDRAFLNLVSCVSARSMLERYSRDLIRDSTSLALALRVFLGFWRTSVRLGVSEDGDWRFTVLCAFVFTIYHFSPGVFSIRNALNNKRYKAMYKAVFLWGRKFLCASVFFRLVVI